jgi:hypothetical protein
MARFYADENFPLPVVLALRQLGHDSPTIQEDGKANQRLSDEAVLSAACDHARAVLTTNRKHFIHLHKSSTHTGIVVCTFDPNFDSLANRIHTATTHNESLTGKLIRVVRDQQ